MTAAAGWRELPPGYVVPGIADQDGRPIRPLCGHASHTAGVGWWSDCDDLATHVRPFTDQSEEYACVRHAGKDER